MKLEDRLLQYKLAWATVPITNKQRSQKQVEKREKEVHEAIHKDLIELVGDNAELRKKISEYTGVE